MTWICSKSNMPAQMGVRGTLWTHPDALAWLLGSPWKGIVRYRLCVLRCVQRRTFVKGPMSCLRSLSWQAGGHSALD